MAEKHWIVQLDGKSRILIFLHTNGPRVISFAVVLVSVLDGKESCITRYDTAHGQAHRDVLGMKGGLLEKQWLLDLTSNEAFDYALSDIKENYDNYITAYKKH